MNSSEGWENITVEDLGEIVAGGTPDRTNPSYWGGSMPWVTPTEITGLKGKYLRETAEYITEAGLAGSAARLLPIGTVVVTTRATLGETAIATVPLATNQGFKNVVPNKETDSLFAYYLLRTLRPEMIRLSSGTTFLEISKSDFARIKTRRPKIDDQRRIAAVLDTVDEAIAKTEAVIAKSRQVCTGMLHDLLTCGLDENGQIRNPITQPEQFKDSSVGPIPKSWRSRSLWELVPIAEYGISSPLYDSGKTPVLRMNNLSDGEASLTDLRFTNAEIPEDLILRPNDVLFNRTNSMVHVGRTGIWRGQIERATFASYLVRLSPNPDLLTPEYLNLLLNLPETQIKMRRFATPAVQQVNINPTNLRKIVVAVPDDLQEQILVVDRISDVSENIRQRQIILTKLQSLKHGLMSDLLTGRVRVPEGII
jgi:type I restriction enzyme S subunit